MSLEQEISDKDTAILEAMKNLDAVKGELYEVRKRSVELTEAARRGKYLIDKLTVEKKILERQFWAQRNG